MRETKVYCDICGIEITSKNSSSSKIQVFMTKGSAITPIESDDTCKDCSNKIGLLITNIKLNKNGRKSNV